MGTNELQVVEFEIKKLTPAKIESNIEELENFMIAVKEKYHGWIVTEDEIKIATEERTKLNKLEKTISEERKRIQKEANADIEKLIEKLKTAEKDTKALSNNISEQIKEFEEKEWETKREEISEIIDNIFRENVDLKIYLIENEKWRNKTMTLSKIEAEIEEQFKKLEKKQGFIKGQLESVNEEIENKIKFEDVQHLMNAEFDEIMKTLVNKKNEIKATEENIKKRAEEEKRRALEELERKKEQEKKVAVEEAIKKEATENSHISSTAKEKEVGQTNIPLVEKNAENEKHFDTTIRFENAPLSFLKELKALSDKYEIKYQLKENMEL